MQKYFESCRKCVAPKRHAGCQAECPDYIADNAAWQEERLRIKAEREKEAEMLAYRRDQSIRRKRKNSERVT